MGTTASAEAQKSANFRMINLLQKAWLWAAQKKRGKNADNTMLWTVLKSPANIASEMKKELPSFRGSVSVHTIQQRLKVDLKLSCRTAERKPLIINKMKKKRMQFARMFINWIKEQWGNIMVSCERIFRTLRVMARTIR